MVKATREDQNIFVKGNPRSDQVKYVDLEGYVRNVSPFKIVQDAKTGQIAYQTVCNVAARERAPKGEKNEAKYVPTTVIMRTTEPPLFLLNPNTKLELFGYYFDKRDNPNEKMFRAVKATTIVFDKSEPATKTKTSSSIRASSKRYRKNGAGNGCHGNGCAREAKAQKRAQKGRRRARYRYYDRS
jgi:hypothetical protein